MRSPGAAMLPVELKARKLLRSTSSGRRTAITTVSSAAITATGRGIGLKPEINELTLLSRAEHDHAVENEDIGQGLCGPAPVVIQVYKFLAFAEGERFGEEQRQTVEYKPVTEIAQQRPLHDSAGHERADRGDRRKDLRVARPEEDPSQAHEMKHQDDRHDRPDPPAEKANDVLLDVEHPIGDQQDTVIKSPGDEAEPGPVP